MAWIESHQSLQRHPKVVAAAALLRVDRHRFIGHLHCLWWWALDVADIDGFLPEIVNDFVLAGAAEWPLKTATKWSEALISVGFLEHDNATYRLHDWYEYAGKLNAKRIVNKERMREARATHVQRTTVARAGHVLGLPTQPAKPTAQTGAEAAPTRAKPAKIASAEQLLADTDWVADTRARFAQLDFDYEITKWQDYVTEKPPKGNWKNSLRNWMEKAVTFKEARNGGTHTAQQGRYGRSAAEIEADPANTAAAERYLRTGRV